MAWSGMPARRRSPRLMLVVGIVVVVVAAVAISVAGGRGANDDETSAPGAEADDDDAVDGSAPTTSGEEQPDVADGPPDEAEEADRSDDVEDESEGERPPSAAGLTPDEAAAEAEVALLEYLALADEAYRDGAEPAELGEVATGPARAEVGSALAEADAMGYRQTGGLEVVDLEVASIDIDAEPAIVEFTACLDASGIAFVDAGGEAMPSPPDDQPRESRHEYGVVFEDGAWRVTTHGFPDDPSC